MIRLELSKKSSDFRNHFKEWLEGNRPPDISLHTSSLSDFVSVGRKWQNKLAKSNWIGVHWPSQYGGRSLSLVEEAIIQEELTRYKAPQILGLFGLTMVGPVLIKHGTDNQKERFLAKILSAEEIWCQGFSEPGAGSDLAAIKTRAMPVQDGFEITGQKVWTSFAQVADWCFLLCRTSDTGARHEGLSYLLVDMKNKGISSRPLRQITGDEEFNEVFFDSVFVPKENIVGNVGEGWKIAISTLMYERVVLTFARMLQSEVALREIIDKFSRELDSDNHRALSLAISQTCAVRALAYEHLLKYSGGALPGPEGSLVKLLWSESFQSLSKLALNIIGSDAVLGEHNKNVGEVIHRYLYSLGRTIAAGTSEIQRNIIAERLLDLPRLKYSYPI